MKKNYENIEMEIVFFCNGDIITESDNVTDFPEFPESMGR